MAETAGRTVVVAEKPSVGRDIARVLGCSQRGEGCLSGGGYVVTWAVGHLVTLQEPDEMDAKYKRWSFDTLPILPEDIPLKVIPSSKAQFAIVKALINAPETTSVICATDAGREGELIFRYIYIMAKCKKPVQRLWINSMTDEAIRQGFADIRPGADYDGLFRSARCRSEADWLVGMNASRAFTLRYDALLSVGRVQTPTLALLVRRRREIEAFKPEKYAVLMADFGDYRGMWFSPALSPDTHLKDKAAAEAIARRIKGKTGVVAKAETARKRQAPPQLFDLTSLQREANQKLGFTADRTLKLAQELYEKHKALTYPRTDSRYLPPDMIPKVGETFRLLPPTYQQWVPLTQAEGKLRVSPRTIDAGKVTDHHALIPTAHRVNPDSFSPDERALYDLVVRRTLAAFCPDLVYDATTVITRVEEETFRTRGRTVVEEGWRAIPPAEQEKKERGRKKDADAEDEDAVLPPLKEGDSRTVAGTAVKEDATKPPAQMNDASLLRAMETAGAESDDREIVRQMKGSGIGTPATRAAIIERLIKVGYVQRKGKQLLATDKGVQLIDVMPEALTSAETTGRWELALDKITRDEQDPVAFMGSIRRFTAYLVDYARNQSPAVAFPGEERRGGGRKSGGWKNPPVEGAVCPLCGKGKVLESPRAFSCDQSGCALTLWKDALTRGGGPELTQKLLLLLLERKTLAGSTGTVTLTPQEILFTPAGRTAPSVRRALAYVKQTARPTGGRNSTRKDDSHAQASQEKRD
ncbi:MAG: DNA topoisomerase 3 [Clostridia bacterium]|nr:DNA topoisomerase 3 [Clostridia bacterium]